MKQLTIYRLECSKHFWNFDTAPEAKDAAKELPQCTDHYTIKEVLEFFDESGMIVETKERLLQ
jgi:hypothetical protein